MYLNNDIAIFNPWWSDENWSEKDQHLSAIQGRSYYRKSTWLETLPIQPGDFHVIRGPRQVGKTTLLKELIFQLIQVQHLDPKSILYYSCETLVHFSDLSSLLTEWLHRHKERVSFVLLDEISFVPEWQRALLHCFNAGLLSKTLLVVTGSNARDLKVSQERFPGRRGSGKDIEIFPVAPWEYRDLECFRHLDQETLISTYMKVGGFPHAIRDFVEKGQVTDETFTTYRNWILGDASRYNLSQEFLQHILYRIAETLGSRITWNSLIGNTPVQSHETAAAYLEHLADSFLVRIMYCMDEHHFLPAIHKARKLVFVDPLLHYLALAWRKGLVNIWRAVDTWTQDPEFLGPLFESCVLANTSRLRQTVYFWYSSKQHREVDLVLSESSGLKLYDCAVHGKPSFKALNRHVQILDHHNVMNFWRSLRPGGPDRTG
jgi:hypothetical protein